ncbi:hypothetical protein R6Z07M_015551 [Ovis aries]
MAHLKHQSAVISLLGHRAREGLDPESEDPELALEQYMPTSLELEALWPESLQQKHYDLGLPEEEEGITYYIRYCPEDDSYLPRTDCERQGCLAHDAHHLEMDECQEAVEEWTELGPDDSPRPAHPPRPATAPADTSAGPNTRAGPSLRTSLQRPSTLPTPRGASRPRPGPRRRGPSGFWLALGKWSEGPRAKASVQPPSQNVTGRRRSRARAEAQANGAAPRCCVRTRRGLFRRLPGMRLLGYGLRLLEAGSGSRPVTRLPLGADMPKKGGATNKGKNQSKEPERPLPPLGPVTVDPKGGVSIAIHAKPGSKQNAVTDVTAEAVSVAIAAPPTEGEANAELCRYLSKVLELRKSDVVLDKGGKSREKVVKLLASTPPEEILEKLKKQVEKK